MAGGRDTHRAARGLKAYVPEALLALTVIGAPLAIGSVHLEVRIAVAALPLAALLWCWWVGEQRRRLGLIGIGLALALVWSFLQWVPLPSGVSELLAPASQATRSATAAALGGESPSWHPLSLDAPRTALAWLSLAGLFATYVVAANLRPTGRSGRRRIGLYVLAATVAVLAVGLVQALAGAEQIYGWYEASVDLSARSFQTTFVNPNHAAALLLLGACMAAGLGLDNHDRPSGKWYLAGALALGLGTAATGSKGGHVTLVVAFVALAAYALLAGRERIARQRVLVLFGGAACVTALVLALAGGWTSEWSAASLDSDWLQRELADRWQLGADVALAHWRGGAGHGAFGVASASLTTDWRNGHMHFAHNGVLQAVADWGVLVAALVSGLLLVGLLRICRAAHRAASFALVATCVGLGALVLHDLGDFAMWIPGVGYPAAAAAGWVTGQRRRRARSSVGEESGRRPLVGRVSMAALLALPMAFIALSIDAAARDPARSSAAIREALAGQAAPELDLAQLLEDHPADYYLHLLGAVSSERRGELELASRLAARAAELAPSEPQTLRQHAVIALKLGRKEQAAAFLERLAQRHPAEAAAVVLAHGELGETRERFFRADSQRVAAAADLLRRGGAVREGEQLLRWGVGAHPDDADLWDRLGQQSLTTGTPEQLDQISVATLSRGGLAEDDEQARRFKRTGYLTQGYVLARAGRYEAAWRVFDAAARLDPERAVAPLIQAGRALAELGDIGQLRALLERLRVAGDGDAWSMANYHLLSSRLHEGERDLRGAVRQMQRALAYRPGDPAYLGRLARLYRQLGDGVSARRALELAARDAGAERGQ